MKIAYEIEEKETIWMQVLW